ncbi:hypothetical protein [Sphingobacterium sp. UBA6645]|uniref:hypothetical protein n=1 Tax=Sphingobacterium sp. UBA6645 TaxID=1947511 RepID=UPI0025FF2D23|nr:hypothetical protein [Sphingobacterium sp. UBA6645]
MMFFSVEYLIALLIAGNLLTAFLHLYEILMQKKEFVSTRVLMLKGSLSICSILATLVLIATSLFSSKSLSGWSLVVGLLWSGMCGCLALKWLNDIRGIYLQCLPTLLIILAELSLLIGETLA